MTGPRLGWGAALAAAAMLAGCAQPVPPDAHIPDFARRPYEPFSRDAAVAIALREWRVFGQPVDDAAPDTAPQATSEDKPERVTGLWQRVGEYWWLGLDTNRPERAWTGKHDQHGQVFPPEHDGAYAWSAAFISYVMRIAGAGPRFPYSASHSDYINRARTASAGTAVVAERPDTYPPQLGDLICQGRGAGRDVRFEDLPAGHFPAHCDLLVDRQPGQIAVVGGNVDDAVTLKHVPVDPSGLLWGPDGRPLDPRYPWFVVLRVRYDR